MNDEEYEAAKNRITALIDKWVALIDLDGYYPRLSSEFQRDTHPDEVASTWSRWDYRMARFTWWVPDLAKMSDEELEHIVVHEMAHALVSPAQHDDVPAAQRELATENVACALLAAARAD